MDQPAGMTGPNSFQPKSMRSRRLKQLARWSFLGGLVVVIGAEAAARLVFGLGDPPLFIRDPDIEYLYKPSASYRYRHHEVSINSRSMRSPEFPAKKTHADELRVMVFGDSIVTGGGRIDQSELATERLRESMAQTLSRPVVVGNIAAWSWGPPNQFAYARRFGFFEADVVLLVLNSGDADDVPGLEAIGANNPEHTPVLALQEPGRRLLQRLAPGLTASLGLLTPARRNERGELLMGYEQRCTESSKALAALVRAARDSGASVGAIQYWTLAEMQTAPLHGHDLIQAQLQAADVPTWQTAVGISQSRADPAWYLSNDRVHPSAAGHERLAAIFAEAVTDLLARRDGAEPRSENEPSTSTPGSPR